MAGMTSIIMTCLSGLHKGLVLLKDLSNLSRPNRTYMSGKVILKCVGNLADPIPHGFTWDLVLLKDLPKPPIPVRILIPKSKWKSGQYLRQRSK
jgi:hypothetical protein